MDEVLKNANSFSEGENLYEIIFVVLSPTIILINGISLTYLCVVLYSAGYLSELLSFACFGFRVSQNSTSEG